MTHNPLEYAYFKPKLILILYTQEKIHKYTKKLDYWEILILREHELVERTAEVIVHNNL